MKKKLNLAIVFGGRSTEHEISVRSARSIIESIDTSKYNVSLMGIDKSGKWYLNEYSHFLQAQNQLNATPKESIQDEISVTKRDEFTGAVSVHSNKILQTIDIVFPILHGSFGEDGTIQGLLRALDIPFVGVDLLASAIGMDKDVTKRLLRDAGIPIANYVCLTHVNFNNESFELISERLGLPLFVKPANAGSSVGVHKVHSAIEFSEAIQDAFQYDNKILVEEAIIGKEVECAILGNEDPIASVVGEIVPQSDFYTYESKYLKSNDAIMKIPADIDPTVAELIRRTAIKAFQVITGEGLARVDFFLKKDNSIVLNEINTMPGFTSISMYPKLWEATGIPYSELLDRLIDLAIERHNRNKKLKNTL